MPVARSSYSSTCTRCDHTHVLGLVIETPPRKFGHAGLTPLSRAWPSARRTPGFAERRPRRPRRASTAGPPNGPRGPFGPRAPSAPRHASRSARGLCAPRGAPSPSTAGLGESFAPRSPSRTAASMAKLSRDRRAGRKMEPRAENSRSRSVTYGRDASLMVETSTFMIEIHHL